MLLLSVSSADLTLWLPDGRTIINISLQADTSVTSIGSYGSTSGNGLNADTPRKVIFGLPKITLKRSAEENGTSLALLITGKRSYLNMPLIPLSNDMSSSMARLIHTVHYGTSTTGEDMLSEWPPDFVLPGNMITFRVLEPYAMKVARTVLRRERRGNPPDLSDAAPTRVTIYT